MFSFAALVIHSVFRTDHTPGRSHINMTSGYVDLAPLYGNDQEMQDRVRIKEGRGLLHPDVFAEDRLLFLPPAVCVLLVLFNRNHNVRYLNLPSYGYSFKPFKSTSPVGCLRSTNEVPGRTPPSTTLAMLISPSKTRKSSRLHASATVHGSQLLFSLTTSRAFWASCDRGQAGVWSRSRKYVTKTTLSLSVAVVTLAVLNSTACTDGTRRHPSRMKNGLLSSSNNFSLQRSLKISL